ncbi:MAG: 7-carboxy-7-deazaguanine synthase QueE [Methanosarcinales archaeon]
MKAQISEIFNSIQGEGIYVGTRQVFVRFQKCQLNCIYCDTYHKISSKTCRIYFNRDFYTLENPLDLHRVIKIIDMLWTPSTKNISLTGGEPLIHADFINELGRMDIKKPLYLETNSGFPDLANKIKDVIDIAACDIKLPEHKSTENYNNLLKNELETLRIFYNSNVKTFAKIIILSETNKESIIPAIEGIANISKLIPLVLQPVSIVNRRIKNKPTAKQIMELMDFASEYIEEVRVIPQTHKQLNIL